MDPRQDPSASAESTKPLTGPNGKKNTGFDPIHHRSFRKWVFLQNRRLIFRQLLCKQEGEDADAYFSVPDRQRTAQKCHVLSFARPQTIPKAEQKSPTLRRGTAQRQGNCRRQSLHTSEEPGRRAKH